jgi:hypothetical protein
VRAGKHAEEKRSSRQASKRCEAKQVRFKVREERPSMHVRRSQPGTRGHAGRQPGIREKTRPDRQAKGREASYAGGSGETTKAGEGKRVEAREGGRRGQESGDRRDHAGKATRQARTGRHVKRVQRGGQSDVIEATHVGEAMQVGKHAGKLGRRGNPTSGMKAEESRAG